MNSRTNDQEFERLSVLLVAGTITRQDEQRLLNFARDQWGIPDLKDDDIRRILVTGHDDYGKPDSNGEVREL